MILSPERRGGRYGCGWGDAIAPGRPADTGHRARADGFGAVLADLARMDEESVLILWGLPPAQRCEPVTTPAGAPLAAWKWLRAMAEHEVHHRGQLYPMLGMPGVARPLIDGLSSEQVRERSIHA